MISMTENSFSSAKTLVINAKKSIEEIARKDGLSGIPTGFIDLDRLTSGWQNSELIVIASQSGIGKTSLILSMIRNIGIDYKIPLALFTPEMTSQQVIYKLMCQETKIPIKKLRDGSLESYEWELLSVKVKSLEEAPIFIDDTAKLNIFSLKEKIKNLIINSDVRIIFIDNIHLIEIDDSQKRSYLTREQELSIIIRELKSYSKEFSIPIVAVSQLSREIEKRIGCHKRPILSDLRGSGTIEEVADIVSFIYRPEYYKIDEWDDEEHTPTQDQAEFIVAKNRNGALDQIRLKFINNLGRFENLDEFDSTLDSLPSKMGLQNNNPFLTPNEAFGSNMNSFEEDDSDVPF
jgi:replicative DNA helicase